jgi:phenylpropionate dioxygenase-like ring-hydroxylating dioxygenase large terminal subunit
LTVVLPAAMTAAMSSPPIAVYDRRVRASLERVWENVFDWEHLPWLHPETFGHVRFLGTTPTGYRAETSLSTMPARTPFVIEVDADRAAGVYHSRTIDGPGTGTDVFTRLVAADAHATDVRVAFLAPGVDPDRSGRIGDRLVATYALLWDQDEAMMIRRQALVDGRLPARERTVHIAGAACSFSTVCPHLGGPLDDAPVGADGVVACPWHGYRFDVRTGRRVCAPTPG